MRSFSSLSEQELLALAISLEEEDARIFGDFAHGLQADFPATAAVLSQMREHLLLLPYNHQALQK